MRSRDGVLFMSIPSAAPRATGDSVSPIGFMLSGEHLVTIRYTPLKSFDAVAAKFADGGGPASGLDAFVTLCEEIVDRIADSLEHLAGELAPLSEAAFHVDDVEGHKAVRSNKLLRVQLRSSLELAQRPALGNPRRPGSVLGPDHCLCLPQHPGMVG